MKHLGNALICILCFWALTAACAGGMLLLEVLTKILGPTWMLVIVVSLFVGAAGCIVGRPR